MREHNQEMIKNMSQFIKRNKKLLHLNLDSTFLSEYMLFHLCSCLTRSQSCLALHVSGNPGITFQLKEILWRRLRGKNPNFAPNKLDVETDWKRDMESERARDGLMKGAMRQREEKSKAQDETGLDEVTAKNAHSDNRLVLTRVL